MSDKYKGLILTFEKDFSEESAKDLAQLLSYLRGVASVDLKVAGFDHLMAVKQAKSEIMKKLWGVFDE